MGVEIILKPSRITFPPSNAETIPSPGNFSSKKPIEPLLNMAKKQKALAVIEPKLPAKRGRPSLYSEELADHICSRLAKGESLLSICSDDKMPCHSAVRAWAVDDYNGFYAKYARARDIGLEHHAELILKLADEIRPGQRTVSKATGMEVTELDQVERSKLQIDARKWYLSKIAPKRYGDKLEVDQTIKIQPVTYLGGDAN